MSDRTCSCGRTPDPGICKPEDCALRRATGSHCSCIHPPFGDVGREADAFTDSPSRPVKSIPLTPAARQRRQARLDEWRDNA